MAHVDFDRGFEDFLHNERRLLFGFDGFKRRVHEQETDCVELLRHLLLQVGAQFTQTPGCVGIDDADRMKKFAELDVGAHHVDCQATPGDFNS